MSKKTTKLPRQLCYLPLGQNTCFSEVFWKASLLPVESHIQLLSVECVCPSFFFPPTSLSSPPREFQFGIWSIPMFDGITENATCIECYCSDVSFFPDKWTITPRHKELFPNWRTPRSLSVWRLVSDPVALTVFRKNQDIIGSREPPASVEHRLRSAIYISYSLNGAL